jgi:hypothetical protein
MRIRGKKKSNIIFGMLIALFVLGGIAGAYIILNDEGKQSVSKSGKSGVLSLDEKQEQTGDILPKHTLECVPRGYDYYRTNSTLAIDPRSPDTMFVGIEYKGIYKSTDGGMSWRPSDTGIKGYAMEADSKKKCVGELARIVFDPSDSKRLLVSRSESPSRIDMVFGETAGMYESKDGGASWHQVIKAGMNASGSRAVGIDPGNPAVIYYGINNAKPTFTINDQVPSFDLNKTGVLYKSSDGAKGWGEMPTGAEEGLRAINLHIDPKNPATLWLATFSQEPGTTKARPQQKGMLKSTTGGQSWKSYPFKNAVIDSAMASGNGNHVYVSTQMTGEYPEAFYALDGNSFQKSGRYMQFARYDPHDPSGMRMLGYAPFDDPAGIYESKDGGKTWNPYAYPPPGLTNTDTFGVQPNELVWHPTNKDVVFMTGSGAHVWKSINGGKGWAVVLSLEALGANKNKAGSTRSSQPAE